MTEKEVILYESLDLFEWYENLVKKYFCSEEQILKKPSRKEITKVLKKFNYCYSYYPASKVYNFPTHFNGVVFFCNPELDLSQGLIWIHLFAKSKSGELIGGNIISTRKAYEIATNNDSGEYMYALRYSSYEVLFEILKEVFEMYEKFKVAVYESKIL